MNASPATSAWSRPGAGSTSPRLPRGPLDQSPEPRPAAGLTRFRRGLHPCRPPEPHPACQTAPAPSPAGGPLPNAVLPVFLCPPPVHPADTPAPRLQPVCPAQLPAAPGQLSSSRDAHVHAFLPDSLLPRLCTHGWTYSHALTLTHSHIPSTHEHRHTHTPSHPRLHNTRETH